MKEKPLPLQIVMTPVRNEAWCLRAFLASTASWADYIIIADQMSTDGSREIYKEYQEKSSAPNGHFCKLVIIDNKNTEFNESERQAMLVAKARELEEGRDTLLWGLDADEIIAANAISTNDWQRIMCSKPGAVFWFKWAQLTYDKQHYYEENHYYPWLFHDDGVEPHGNYVRAMHSMRIPYPMDEKDMTYINDFHILHLGPAPLYRVKAKERFYMFVDWQVNHRPPYTVGRSYVGSNTYPKNILTLPAEWLYSYDMNGWDFWTYIELDAKHCWMDDYIYERLEKYPLKTLMKLPIWSNEFIDYYHINDPRSWYVRIIHSYMQWSQPFQRLYPIRIIDKLLKLIKK